MSTTATFQRSFACLSVTISFTFYILLSVTLTSQISDANRCTVSGRPACDLCYCSYDRAAVNCSGRQLRYVPSSIPTSAKQVDFSKNQIECVPTSYFTFLSNLVTVDFENNIIQEAFLLPPRVQTLRAKNNFIRNADLFFTHCDNLREVHLSSNNIREVPSPGYRNCSQLTVLDLSSNDFRVIRKNSLQNFPKLKTLRIYGGDHLSVIEEFALSPICSSLQELLLVGISTLTELPVNLLMGCRKLETLKLYSSGLTSIDQKLFLSLENLHALNLGHMNFNIIPEATFHDLKAVGPLSMYFMRLQVLPETLFQYTALSGTLELSGNFLRTLPEGLFSSAYVNHSLSSLVLSGNRLESLPPKLFAPLSMLEELYLDGNKLTQLPAGMLSGLTVTKLYLFQNSLSMLSGNLFDYQLGKGSLKLMQVQKNPLRNISRDFLSSMAEGGEFIVSCDQLQIPKFQPDITISCVPPTFVTSLEVYYEGHSLSLRKRGFSCKKQSHMSICSSCAVGTYGTGNQLTCVLCPRGGFYQDEVGQYQPSGDANGCKTCNSGTFVMSGGGNNPLSCHVCPEGTNKTKHAGYRACFCLENYFRRDRFGKCERCPQDGLNCSNDFVTILPGYYWSWNITNFSLYKTYVENLLTFSDSYDSESTSFQAPFPKVYECPQRRKCSNNGSSIQLEATCEEGYRGWMCTECEKGYFPVIGFCQKCPSIWAFVAEIFAFILVAICFFAYVAYAYRRERNATKRSVVDIALARGKIVLAFYQIMGEFWDSLDVVNWPYVFRQVANWLNIVQFNIAVLVVKPCCFFPKIDLSPYQMFIFGVSLPPVVGLLTTFILLLGYSRLWYLKRKNIRIENWNLTLQRLKDRILTMALMTLYVTYPSTSNAIFTLYPPACETFDLDETKNTEKINLLRSNYSINCDTDIHFKFKTAAYIATLYVLAFPCVLFCLLKKYLKSGATTLTSSRQKNPKWLRFLCENYKDEFWFWEIIELMRRVSQTFVIILFGWGSSLSVTVTLTVAVVFLTLHASYAPMRDKFEHYLQLASLWAIFLNMLVAAVPVADPAIDSPRIEPVMTAILIGLNLSVLLIVIAKPLLWVLNLMKPWKVVSWITELLPTINWRTESSTFSTSTETSVSQYDDSPTDNEPFLHRPNNYHSLPERF